MILTYRQFLSKKLRALSAKGFCHDSKMNRISIDWTMYKYKHYAWAMWTNKRIPIDIDPNTTLLSKPKI